MKAWLLLDAFSVVLALARELLLWEAKLVIHLTQLIRLLKNYFYRTYYAHHFIALSDLTIWGPCVFSGSGRSPGRTQSICTLFRL